MSTAGSKPPSDSVGMMNKSVPSASVSWKVGDGESVLKTMVSSSGVETFPMPFTRSEPTVSGAVSRCQENSTSWLVTLRPLTGAML